MTAIITANIASMMATQRFSTRVISSSGTTPSGSRCLNGFEMLLANASSRHEQNEIEEHPTDEEQPDGNAGQEERAARPVSQQCGGALSIDRCGHVLKRGRSGLMWCVRIGRHPLLLFRCCEFAVRPDLLVVRRDLLVRQLFGDESHCRGAALAEAALPHP